MYVRLSILLKFVRLSVRVVVCQYTGFPVIDYHRPGLQIPGPLFVLNIPEWPSNSPRLGNNSRQTQSSSGSDFRMHCCHSVAVIFLKVSTDVYCVPTDPAEFLPVTYQSDSCVISPAVAGQNQ